MNYIIIVRSVPKCPFQLLNSMDIKNIKYF